MSSRWNHLLCEGCWRRFQPGREPVRVVQDPTCLVPEPCCMCFLLTTSGIYIRAQWGTLPCNGVGVVHAD